MKTFAASLLSVLCFASVGYAGQDAGKNDAPAAGPALSFDELRVACQNPAKFHNQIAPANIQVTCKDIQEKWVADPNGSLQMATERAVTTVVQSDKYSQSSVEKHVPSAATVVACPTYKQVTETVTIVQATTCDQLIAFTGTATDYCVGAIDAQRAANPQLITTADTGRVMNFCSQNPNPKP